MKQNAYFEISEDGKEIIFQVPLWLRLFTITLYTMGYLALIAAIFNVLFVRPLPLFALLSSLAWIAIQPSCVIYNCRKHGTRQHIRNVWGQFVRNHFVQFTVDASNDPVLCFGYMCGAKRNYFLKVKSTGITGVDWGEDQANNPKVDNFWHVAMWFDPCAVVFDGSHSTPTVWCIGPSRCKADTETFGKRVVAFFIANGVHLTVPPGEMLGQEAVVIEALHPLGKIRVGGREYFAKPIAQMMDAGCAVVITEIRGTLLYVRAKQIK